MAGTDGSIRIQTKLDNDDVEVGYKELIAMTKHTASNIKKIFNNGLKSDGLKKQLKEQNDLIKANERQISSYKKRLDSLDNEKAVKNVQRMIEQNNRLIEKAKSKVDDYQSKLDSIDIKKSAIESKEIENSKIGLNDTDENVDKRVSEALAKNKEYQRLLSEEQKLVDKTEEYSNKIEKANHEAENLQATLANAKENASLDLSTNIGNSSSVIESSKQKVAELEQELAKLKGKGDISKDISKTESALGKTAKAASKFGTHVSNAFERGTKKLLKMSAAIFGVRAAYSVARRAANEYLSTNEELAGQVTAIWSTVAQVVGPIVEQIIGWVVMLIGYINSFIKALTGVDLVAKANAAALDKQAKASGNVAKQTKDANRQLAAFDEMNVLHNQSNESSGGGGINVPTLDVDSVDIFGLKEKFEQLFKPILDAWDKYGTSFMDSFNKALENTWKTIKSIGKSFETVWLNGTGEETCSLILEILTNVFDTIGDIQKKFGDAWNSAEVGTSIIQNIWDIFNNLLKDLETFTKFLGELVKKIDFKSILDGINYILDLFNNLSRIGSSFWDEFFGDILNADWKGAGKSISDSFVSALDAIRNWISNIDWFQLGYDIASLICDGISAIIEILANVDWFEIIASLFTLIGEAVLSVGELLTGIIGALLEDLWEVIKSAFNYEIMFKFIEDSIMAIFDALQSVGPWFDEKFQEAYDLICDIFSGIGKWAEERYEDICNGFDSISQWFQEKFDESMGNIESAFEGARQWASDRAQDIMDAFHDIGEWFGELFQNAWLNITDAFSFSKVKDFFKGCYENIKGVFGNIADWFREKFTKAWEAVKKVFSTGGKIFDGIKDGILNGLKTIVNGIIDGINKVISIPFNGLNSALENIRGISILGKQPFGWISTIDVPRIPKLAKGGIVNNPGAGINMGSYIGGEKGPEAVLPLTDSDFIKDFAKMVAYYIAENDNGQPTTIVLKVGDKEFYRWFLNMKRKYEFVMNGG